MKNVDSASTSGNFIKGALSRAWLQKFKSAKTFYSNGNLQILVQFWQKLQFQCNDAEKSSIVIPPGAQDPNLEKSAWFFQVLPP